VTVFVGVAESDCELLRDGLVAQPVNTLSSLAYVVVGVWILLRITRGDVPRRGVGVALGAATISVGLGSVAFHGPGGDGGRFVHDFSIAALLLVVIGSDLVVLRSSWLPAALGAAGAAVVLVVAPDSSNAVTAVLAVVAAGAELAVYRIGKLPITTTDRVAYGIAAAALALAATAQLLGRTDGPLCTPESLWQGHAIWHVLTAVALGAWSAAALDRKPAPSFVR
jgi:Ceramidase